MKTRILVAALALCLALPAAAQFKVTARAYESSLDGFSAPDSANGGVVFRPCAQCPLKRLPVNADTIYKVKGERVLLEAFREAIDSAPESDNVSVTVKHHLESNTIVSLHVWY